MQLFHVNAGTALNLIADHLWDGLYEGYRHRVVISIRQGRIAAIRPWNGTAAGQGAQQVRLAGLTVLPGLIDAHVHLALDGVDFHTSLARWREAVTMEGEIARALRLSLNYGLVAIRDGGDGQGFNLQARQWVASGRHPGPQVIATGMAITKKGYYGSFLGPGTTGEASLLGLIASQVEHGADQVKIVISGIVTFRRYGEVGRLEFSPGELAAAVRLAHRMGRPVMAHVNSAAGVDLALAAGVDSIEHGYFLTAVQLETMAARGIYWVPTVAAIANRLQTIKKAAYTAAEIDIIHRTCEHQLEMIAKACRLGVRLAVGTDAGAPGVYHGASYGDELKYWQQAGLPPAAILRAATVTAAAALGLEGELGQVRPGYRPCLVAVRGNPLEDPGVLRHPEMVFVDTPANG